MRTTVDIPDELMKQALKMTGLKTKRAVIMQALDELVKHKLRERLISRFGKGWGMTLEDLRKLRGKA